MEQVKAAEIKTTEKHNEKLLALAISLLRDNTRTPDAVSLAKLLADICLIFPANKTLLDTAPHASAGLESFDFLKSMKPEAIAMALREEKSEKIALISFFLNREETARVLASLEAPMIIEVISQIAGHARTHFASIKHDAIAFANRIKAKASNPKADTVARIVTPPPFKHANSAGQNIPEFQHPATPSDQNWQNMPNYEEIETICILS
jgi:hypothetical protein